MTPWIVSVPGDAGSPREPRHDVSGSRRAFWQSYAVAGVEVDSPRLTFIVVSLSNPPGNAPVVQAELRAELRVRVPVREVDRRLGDVGGVVPHRARPDCVTGPQGNATRSSDSARRGELGDGRRHVPMLRAVLDVQVPEHVDGRAVDLGVVRRQRSPRT